MLQGVPGERPRYDSGEIYVISEADGRIEVIETSGLPGAAPLRAKPD